MISARCIYAYRALLELSKHWPAANPLQVQYIARNQNIPVRYLVQILIHLKRFGFVESVRGKEGGYYLKVPPETILLIDVLKEIGGPMLSIAGGVTRSKSDRVLADCLEKAEKAAEEVFEGVTFESIKHKDEALKNAVSYQI
jgi:Rrf2 family protein